MKRKGEKVSAKVRRPDPGQTTAVGRQGRIGISLAALLTQHLLTCGSAVCVVGCVRQEQRKQVLL